MEHHQELDQRRARAEAVDLTEDSPAIAAGESMTMDNEHTSFWHAVLELKQQDRNTPKPPSTGGDWELLSPAKGASACGSSAHSEGDHEEGLHEDHVSEQHAASEVHEETVVDPLHPCKEPVDSQTVYVVQDSGKSVEGDDEFHALEKPSAAVDGLLGLTWLMSWISPPLACPTVSGINEYMQQAVGHVRTFVCREWATVGLGAGVVVLGTMLCSSYVHNRRMATMLRSKDREVAKLVMKILSLQDTLQGRRLPIVRHTAWASFPSEIM